MPKIDFYIIEQNSLEACYPFICRIAGKAYQNKHVTYIHCQDVKQASAIDDKLWNFNDTSFIPHALSNQSHDERPPLVIGTENTSNTQYDVLINLTTSFPDECESFERIIEIVFNEPSWKKMARNRYKAYQALNFPLESHHV